LIIATPLNNNKNNNNKNNNKNDNDRLAEQNRSLKEQLLLSQSYGARMLKELRVVTKKLIAYERMQQQQQPQQ
jgi:hypothetical protein